jgi:hypothetical protein
LPIICDAEASKCFCGGCAAEQCALRTLGHFHARNVEERHVGALCAWHRHFVEINRHGRIGQHRRFLLALTANRKYRHLSAAGQSRRGDQVGHLPDEIGQLRDAGALQLLRAERRYRERHLLEVLFAPLRSHDDFLEAGSPRIVGRCIRVLRK